MVPVAWGVAGTFETLFHAVSVGVQNCFVKMVALDCGVFSLRISGRCWDVGLPSCTAMGEHHVNVLSGRTAQIGNLILLFHEGWSGTSFWVYSIQYTYYIILWSRPFCLPDDPGSSPKLFALQERIAFVCARSSIKVHEACEISAKFSFRKFWMI